MIDDYSNSSAFLFFSPSLYFSPKLFIISNFLLSLWTKFDRDSIHRLSFLRLYVDENHKLCFLEAQFDTSKLGGTNSPMRRDATGEAKVGGTMVKPILTDLQ